MKSPSSVTTFSILSLKLLQAFATVSLLKDPITSLIFWIRSSVLLWGFALTFDSVTPHAKLSEGLLLGKIGGPDLLLPHRLDVALIGHDPVDHHRGGKICWHHYWDLCLIRAKTTVKFSIHFQLYFWCLYNWYTEGPARSPDLSRFLCLPVDSSLLVCVSLSFFMFQQT